MSCGQSVFQSFYQYLYYLEVDQRSRLGRGVFELAHDLVLHGTSAEDGKEKRRSVEREADKKMRLVGMAQMSKKGSEIPNRTECVEGKLTYPSPLISLCSDHPRPSLTMHSEMCMP